jgi:hypothetical protein
MADGVNAELRLVIAARAAYLCEYCLIPALPQESWARSDSALPPDVRRWLCPAVKVLFYTRGLCPWCGLWPKKSEGLSPDQGHSPENNLAAVGGA